MTILNYTTGISAEKTVGEIQQKLAKAGAQAVLCEYGAEGVITGMSFRINTKHGMVFFRMPVNTAGVLRALQRGGRVPPKLRTPEQAAKVALRILKDWIEAQLAIVEAELAEMAEVFLAYAQNDQGKTLYQQLSAGGLKSLTHKKE